MTAVNPVQATTYYLSSGNNPITFGTVTGIDVSSGSGIGVSGSNVQSWAVTNKGAISGTIYGVDLTSGELGHQQSRGRDQRRLWYLQLQYIQRQSLRQRHQHSGRLRNGD